MSTERRAISLRCRSWTCPDCADHRKRILIAQCIGGGANTFLTLTYRIRSGVTPEQAAKQLARAWRLLRLRILRHQKIKKLPFAAIMEKTTLGWPHLHILLRSVWIDQKWISDQMRELIDSPVVWIQRIDRKAKIAGYCAKYAGKAAQKFGSAKRYWFSQDFDLRPKDPKRWTWKGNPYVTVEPCNLRNWIAVYVSQGWTVEQPSAYEARARPPPARAREAPLHGPS